MDSFSYACGVMDAFNEVVKAGVKKMALSHPFEWDERAEQLIEEAEKIAAFYGNQMRIEKELLITDLFPSSSNLNKTVLLFYRDEQVIEKYLSLKEEKKDLIQKNQYEGESRRKIAVEFGKLLSYSEEAIESYLKSNQEKEQF